VVYPPNRVATLRSSCGVKAWCENSMWSHTCTTFLMALTAQTQKSHLPFLTEVSHEIVSRGTSRNPLVTLCLVAARCSFWDRSRNPLGTLGLLHSSHILLWRGAHFDKEILRSALDKEVFSREPARRSCLRDLLLGACTEILPKDFLEN
jgi:hypothetical protein